MARNSGRMIAAVLWLLCVQAFAAEPYRSSRTDSAGFGHSGPVALHRLWSSAIASAGLADFEHTALAFYSRLVNELNQQTAKKYTLLQGTVVEELQDRREFARLHLSVIDKQTRGLVEFVFVAPDRPGHYYVVLETGREYEFLIEVPGYKPNVLAVRTPFQKYFYPMFQQVDLVPVRDGSNRIGQKLRVRNTFFDIRKAASKNNPLASKSSGTDASTYFRNKSQELLAQPDPLDTMRLDRRSSAEVNLIAMQRGKDYSWMLSQIENVIARYDSLTAKALARSALREGVYCTEYLYNDSAAPDTWVQLLVAGRRVTALPPLLTYDTTQQLEPNPMALEMRYTDFEKFNVAHYRASPVELWKHNYSKDETAFAVRFAHQFGARAQWYTKRHCRFLLPFAAADHPRKVQVTRNVLLEMGVPEEAILVEQPGRFQIRSNEYEIFADGFAHNTVEVLILEPLEQTDF